MSEQNRNPSRVCQMVPQQFRLRKNCNRTCAFWILITHDREFCGRRRPRRSLCRSGYRCHCAHRCPASTDCSGTRCVAGWTLCRRGCTDRRAPSSCTGNRPQLFIDRDAKTRSQHSDRSFPARLGTRLDLADSHTLHNAQLLFGVWLDSFL